VGPTCPSPSLPLLSFLPRPLSELQTNPKEKVFPALRKR